MKKLRVILALALLAVMVLPSIGQAAYLANTNNEKPYYVTDPVPQGEKEASAQGEKVYAAYSSANSPGEVGAKAPSSYNMRYYVFVDISQQLVSVYSQGSDSAYSVLERSFPCSTGLDRTPTPTGTFYMKGSRPSWSYFKTYGVYVRYPVRFYGSYYFHSVLYERKDVNTLINSSYNNIGKKASHGCIRLYVEDAKWLSDYCGEGTAVEIVK